MVRCSNSIWKLFYFPFIITTLLAQVSRFYLTMIRKIKTFLPLRISELMKYNLSLK